MSKFDEFFDAVLEGAKDLAKEILQGFITEAGEDTKAFLEKTRADLERWTGLLADKKLTEQDFSDLVLAKKALAQMHALTQTGLFLTKIERFRSSLINLIIDKAFDVFIP